MVPAVDFQLLLPPADRAVDCLLGADARIAGVLGIARREAGDGKLYGIQREGGGDVLDDELLVAEIPRPRFFVAVELAQIVIVGCHVAPCVLPSASTVGDLKAKFGIDREIMARRRLALDPTRQLRDIEAKYGSDLSLADPQTTRVVAIVQGGTFAQFRVARRLSVRELKEIVAEETGVAAEGVDLLSGGAALRDDALLASLQANFLQAAERRVVVRPPDYDAKLRELVERTRAPRRNCARSYSFHDYNFDAALRDLTM